MTKKDFIQISNAIRAFISKTGKSEEARELANIMADICKNSNSRLNRQKFLEACGVE